MNNDIPVPSNVETLSDALVALASVTQSLKSKTLLAVADKPSEITTGGSVDVSIGAIMDSVCKLREVDSQLSKLGIFDRG